MIDFLKRVWNKIFNRHKQKNFTLSDVFGCPERPPQDCPTFLIREVHTKFLNAIQNYNIVVVYGESRQGKTWTIERFCPDQLRIGCTANMDLDSVKKEMLIKVGINVRKIEHSLTQEVFEGEDIFSNFNTPRGILASGANMSTSSAHKETVSTSYDTVDLTNNTEFIEAIKSKASNKYFVLDNFHYLDPNVQKSFCTLLKEFSYQGIKVIIVGVWKDASRITALAPDLVNRCAHVDIGTWAKNELNEVVRKGESALNIYIDDSAIQLFESCCANNIGIFKDYLQRYCQELGVTGTQSIKKSLVKTGAAETVAKDIIDEAYTPLHDRLINLALPQREKKDSKHMRQKIVIAILQLIIKMDVENAQKGFSSSLIRQEVDSLCKELGDDSIPISNLTQELGLLHMREENRQAGSNFIPLFYFDKVNKKLLVIEPTIYEIKSYSEEMLNDIINELKESLVPSFAD